MNLLRVVQSALDRGALAGDIQLRAESHVQAAFPLDDCGEYRPETADPSEMKARRREHVFVTQFQAADG